MRKPSTSGARQRLVGRRATGTAAILVAAFLGGARDPQVVARPLP